jgi:hypothetical protein
MQYYLHVKTLVAYFDIQLKSKNYDTSYEMQAHQ